VATKLDVWNLALSFLDSSIQVQSENDTSTAAGLCKRFYRFARRRVLEKCYWDFATKTPALALILDQTTIAQNAVIYPGWRYVYARPTDCVKLLAVTTAFGLRTNPFMVFWWRLSLLGTSGAAWGPFLPPYVERIDQVATPANQSINILTDQDQAYAAYVTDVENVNLWTQNFMECVAWNMAVPIAGPLSANAAAKQNAIKMAELSITSALMINLNERQEDPYPQSPAITARS
jgi:hypothetical protein